MAKVVLRSILLKNGFTFCTIVLSVIVFLNAVINTHVYSVFDIVNEDDMNQNVVGRDGSGKLCSFSLTKHPTLFYHSLPGNVTENGFSDATWTPAECEPRFSVSIIIPFRNREHHLTTLLNFLHPFLQRQNIKYKIYVIEQNDDNEFNRGKLFNVGFVEALKQGEIPCFIFHDVDLLPLNINNIYACTKYPRHMSSSIDKYRYNVPYDRNFGGVISMLAHQFKHINGFSNKFYGWGGEDDDLFNRIRHASFPVMRYNQRLSRYLSLKHNNSSPKADRYDNLDAGYHRFQSDGLNTLHYAVLKRYVYKTYEHIVVSLQL